MILVLLIPMGIGGGMVIPPLTAALLEVLPPERAGLASGVFNAARQFGGGLGVARVRRAGAHTGSSPGCTSRWCWARSAVAATLVLTLAYVPPDPMGEPEPVGA